MPKPPLTGEVAARQPERFGKPLNEAAVWQRMLVMAAGAFMNFVPVCVKRKTLRHWYPPNANYGKKPATEMATGRNIC